MTKRASGGAVLIACLALFLVGSVALAVEFTKPPMTRHEKNMARLEASLKGINPPSSLTSDFWFGVVAISLGTVGSLLLYLRNQPDSSSIVIRIFQHLTREVVESDPSAVSLPKSEDQRKMIAAQSRAKLDTQFETVLRMAKELDTIEAVHEWRRQERHKILSDRSLAPEEKEERLVTVDESAEREKRRLRENVSVYGDE